MSVARSERGSRRAHGNLRRFKRPFEISFPPEDLGAIVDNIGIPYSGINTSYNNTGTIGPQDGDIQIALKEGHRPTPEYVSACCATNCRNISGVTFSFLPADITSQILNFGAPTPIDLQIRGNLFSEPTMIMREKLLRKIRLVPGVADARIQQSRSAPVFKVNVDRSRAQYVGVTERDVTESLGTSLSGTGQVSPTYWLNPKNGVSYSVVIQTPEYKMDSLAALQNVPVNAPTAPAPQILGAVASFERSHDQRFRVALRHPADGADPDDDRRPRSWRRRRRYSENRRRCQSRIAERLDGCDARTGAAR